MKVFIIGGTGFIGYHATLEFLKREHEVSTIAIPDIKLGKWFPSKVSVQYGDIFSMEQERMVEMLSGFDALVYAIGPDDRTTPDRPPYEFFHEKLALTTQKVFQAANLAKIKRAVILNSYFAYFDRKYPKKKLAIHHPYIQCRIEQAEYAIEAGGEQIDTMILELPYIFGTMPESARAPLWKSVFIDRFKNWNIIFFPKGGSTMITVEHVAEAIVDAMENGKKNQHYVIGDENITWKEMLTIMFSTYGKKKKVISLPKWIFLIVGKIRKWKMKRKEIYEGLDSYYLFSDILTDNFYIELSDQKERLQYSTGGVRESIVKTIETCRRFD
ncbi:hypothetical protein NEF87_003725 [Candidatus Lokiarchaeum ossiferum]|uniref:NAD-dependent epimerase/dehydratase domain-containing protein n=1 Tax=Candidatus Lokiarchaeum ossiferum TaxID=2951803 RepID=A0ABY6HV83_9ARCH|nr:hypothetical protein NEF87_003725 [Candidatus Lokiarchaeum sp. B-35]